LIGHELLDTLKDGFLHGQDLGVDIPPERRLLEGGGDRISLASIPSESSPPLIAATMSGLSCRLSSEFMVL
jgi:hypothetical protein